MNIVNNDNRYTLFWRVFKHNDILCWIGLQEGTVPFGDSDPYDNPDGKFKIEIRHDNLQGASILPVGPVFSNNTSFIFENDVIRIENYSV